MFIPSKSISSCVPPMPVYICLNLLSYVHVFMSSLQLLHRLTPFADMRCVFVFVRTSCFFCPYVFPRDCVYFALCETFGCHVVTDAGLLFWRIRMVLWSPKSLNFSAFSWMRSGFVDSLWVVSFTIIVAVFLKCEHLFCLFYMFPHTFTQ